MVANGIVDMKKGMVAGTVMDRVQARSRQEWEKAAGDRGERAQDLLNQKPGSSGLLWFWNNDNSGDLIMFGLWDRIDRRMGYEDSLAEAVRALTNPLFSAVPRRPRYILTHCYGPANAEDPGVVKMEVGMVCGVIMDRVKARSREEWEKSAGDRGDRATELLRKQPGFRGLQWLWDNANTGDVMMLGLWDGIDRRMDFESSIAESVRSLVNPLFDQTPRRPRYTITHCYPSTSPK